jgi:hypothetical protein
MDIRFQGDCTVARAEELHAALLEAMQAGEPATCSFSGVQTADLSFFLLLHAAQRSFREQGLELTLLADLPRELAARAAFAGLQELAPGETHEADA